MDSETNQPIRILVADDEPAILESYRMVLNGGAPATDTQIDDLKSKLFGRKNKRHTRVNEPEFEVVFTSGAEEAVQAVRESRKIDKRFAIIKSLC